MRNALDSGGRGDRDAGLALTTQPDKTYQFVHLRVYPMMAIYTMNHNFCRTHQTLRVTPAMESGISDHVWSLEEIVGLLP
jgi:hypothetical protein